MYTAEFIQYVQRLSGQIMLSWVLEFEGIGPEKSLYLMCPLSKHGHIIHIL